MGCRNLNRIILHLESPVIPLLMIRWVCVTWDILEGMLHICLHGVPRKAIPGWLSRKFLEGILTRCKVALPSGNDLFQQRWCRPSDVVRSALDSAYSSPSDS